MADDFHVVDDREPEEEMYLAAPQSAVRSGESRPPPSYSAPAKRPLPIRPGPSNAAASARFWSTFLFVIGCVYLGISGMMATLVFAGGVFNADIQSAPFAMAYAVMLLASGVIVFGFFAACASLLNVQADMSDNLRAISQNTRRY